MVQGIVDCFEGSVAVVEIDGKEMKDFPKKVLPKGVKVGDMLISIRYTITISKEGTVR